MITAKDRIIRVTALLTASFGSFLLKADISLPVINEVISAKAINIVVVLIPPPVDDGDAPININIANITILELLKVFKSFEAKPAVLLDTDKNIASKKDTSFFSPSI